MGEVAAACIAGALTVEDAAKVIYHRSRLLGRVVGQGSIAVLGLSRAEIEERFAAFHDRLWIAACNGPSSTAVSGEPALLQQIVAELQAQDVFARIAKADVPAHSPKVDPLRAELFESLRDLAPRAHAAEMFSTVTAAPIAGSQLGPSYWVRNLREPVLFAQAVEAAIQAGCDTFVELSPHPVLVSGIEQSLARAGVAGMAAASGRRGEDERRVMLETAARLFAAGRTVSVNAAATVSDGIAVPVTVSAHTSAALGERCRSLARWVREHGEADVLDIAYTCSRRWTQLPQRVSVVAASREALVDRLEAVARGEARAGTVRGWA
jgi:acyl transferase domain-containing protein